MKKLYKDGKEFAADDNQVDVLLGAGWSFENQSEQASPESSSEVSSDEDWPSDDEEESSDSEAVSSTTHKKVIRKKIK
jgi:hypothetical protein